MGSDQIQHVEFARDWATRFNVAYVSGYNPQDPQAHGPGSVGGILKLPRARVQEQTALVPGVDGRKMSKSYGNSIEMFAEDELVRRQIMSIRTDSADSGAVEQILRKGAQRAREIAIPILNRVRRAAGLPET